LSLHLDRAFTHGSIRKELLKDTGKAKPPSGKSWLILTGLIDHVTATDSAFACYEDDTETYAFFKTSILAAKANGTYPLFGLKADEVQAQWQPVIVQDGEHVKFDGAATAIMKLVVLEW